MAKIFITGSADGLGLRSAQALAERGHQVYLHARNAKRAEDARNSCPKAAGCLTGDLSSTSETKSLATQLNELGPWDAIIHNAGIMHTGPNATVFNVNTMAPYLLTCLVNPPPKRYVFLSSSWHEGGDPSLKDIEQCNYHDSKLHNTMLAFWFAKRFGNRVACNSVDPGWVATKMGGSGATDDFKQAIDTYVILAEGSEAAEGQTGKHWFKAQEKSFKPEAGDEQKQNRLIELLQSLSGVNPPE